MDRESALALLRENHDFPGPYEFRVVAMPSAASAIVTAMGAAAGTDGRIDDVRRRESRTGKYISLRVRMQIDTAERVLDVYEVLNALDGVLTTM